MRLIAKVWEALTSDDPTLKRHIRHLIQCDLILELVVYHWWDKNKDKLLSSPVGTRHRK